MTMEVMDRTIPRGIEDEVSRMETEGPAGAVPTRVSVLREPLTRPDVFAKFAKSGPETFIGFIEGKFHFPGVTVHKSSWEGLDKASAAERVAQAEAYYIGREHSMPD